MGVRFPTPLERAVLRNAAVERAMLRNAAARFLGWYTATLALLSFVLVLLVLRATW